jgi:hypothetical protein
VTILPEWTAVETIIALNERVRKLEALLARARDWLVDTDDPECVDDLRQLEDDIEAAINKETT